MNRITGCPVHAKHVQVFEGLKTCRSRDASSMAPRVQSIKKPTPTHRLTNHFILSTHEARRYRVPCRPRNPG